MLGPKGLMPNIRVGTLVTIENMPTALAEAKAGQATFRVDDGKNIHAPLGKMDFADKDILINMRALVKAIVERRPPTIKGRYLL